LNLKALIGLDCGVIITALSAIARPVQSAITLLCVLALLGTRTNKSNLASGSKN